MYKKEVAATYITAEAAAAISANHDAQNNISEWARLIRVDLLYGEKFKE